MSNDNPFKDKKVVTVLTGSNIDMYLLGQIVSKGLLETGRMLKISIQLVDRPGELKNVVDKIVANRVNIVEVVAFGNNGIVYGKHDNLTVADMSTINASIPV